MTPSGHIELELGKAIHTLLPVLLCSLTYLAPQPCSILLTGAPPPSSTPLTGEHNSWYRTRVAPVLLSLSLQTYSLSYCNLLAPFPHHTANCLGTPALGVVRIPLALWHNRSQPFLLGHLCSSLPPTNQQKHSLPDNL